MTTNKSGTPALQRINPPEIDHLTAAARDKRLRSCPAKYRKLLERAWCQKVAPRVAIKLHCLECVGFQRDEVTTCTGYACPLWRYRPYQPKPGKGEPPK